MPVGLVGTTVQGAMRKAGLGESGRTCGQWGYRALAAWKLKLAVCAVLVAGVAGFGAVAVVPADKSEVNQVDSAATVSRSAPELKTQIMLDALGDPLPPGALMRLGSMRLQHEISYYCTVAFSPVSDQVALSGRYGVRIWDAESGKELHHFPAPRMDFSAVAFAPDGKLIAGSAGDGMVGLWETVTGNEVRRLAGLKKDAVSMAFSAQGDVLAVGGVSDLHLWDVPSGKLLHVIHSDAGLVESVAISPDGRQVAAAGMGIWDIATGKLLHAHPASKPYASAVVFSKDGRFLIGVGQDATIVWETTTGEQVERLKVPQANNARTVALSPDGQTLAIGGHGHVTHLWDWSAAKGVRTINLQTLGVYGVAFSRNGKTLAVRWTAGEKINLWDVATGQAKDVVSGHRQGLSSVA